MNRVEVTVWSDFACPWCWIAKRRLEQAIAAAGDEFEVLVTYKAYRLARGMAPTDFRTALAQKFGSVRAANEMMREVSRQAEQEGLEYRFESMLFGDTTVAHALVKSAGSADTTQRIVELIYQAGTAEGKDIYNRSVLQPLASEAGIPLGQIDFDSEEQLTKIGRDELEASRIASGVPLFVFNSQAYISGAQPLRAFEEALRRNAVSVGKLERPAPTCKPDSCK